MSQSGSFTQNGGPLPPTVLETLTADVGGPVPATLNNINIFGGDNINTVGTPGTSTIEVFLNETIHWPDTNNTGTQGAIYLGGSGGTGGDIFMHNFSTQPECTFLGQNAGGDLTVNGTDNTGLGSRCLQHLAGNPAFTGGNTAVGSGSLSELITGGSNTGIGNDTLASLVDGFNNFAGGDSSLFNLHLGSINQSSYNTAIGTLTGLNLLTGNFNTLIGSGDGTVVLAAGQNYTGAESSNILINNGGVVGESNVIRIGTAGVGDGQQNACYIAGIFGATVGVSGVPVNVDNAGQLGTVVSSIRFKENIRDMMEWSEDIYKLRPVLYTLKEDKQKNILPGLIAEDVEKIIPGLVVKDKKGDPFSVKYQDLPVLLLNEIQKLNAMVNSLVRRINLLEKGE